MKWRWVPINFGFQYKCFNYELNGRGAIEIEDVMGY